MENNKNMLTIVVLLTWVTSLANYLFNRLLVELFVWQIACLVAFCSVALCLVVFCSIVLCLVALCLVALCLVALCLVALCLVTLCLGCMLKLLPRLPSQVICSNCSAQVAWLDCLLSWIARYDKLNQVDKWLWAKQVYV